jgi:methylenetetrahydrofolate reductase (NADPH)
MAADVGADAVTPPLGKLDVALRERRFIVTAEVTSPIGANAASLRRRARLLSGHVVAVNVPDGQAATAHLGPLAAARLLLDEGVEPVLTLQCRDRNRLALQSELIGAAALGVHNVLCLTGDAPPPGAAFKPVFDLDSVGLLQAASGLAVGLSIDGAEFRSPARLVLGAAAHPLGPTEYERIERMRLKIEAGAQFFQTQYVFEVDAFARWMYELRTAGLHERAAILATVGPLRSPRVMGFLRALPGVRVPAEVERRFNGLSGDVFAEESVRLCAETARALADIPGVAGIHIIAPYWEDQIPQILTMAGLAGRTMRATS